MEIIGADKLQSLHSCWEWNNAFLSRFLQSNSFPSVGVQAIVKAPQSSLDWIVNSQVLVDCKLCVAAKAHLCLTQRKASTVLMNVIQAWSRSRIYLASSGARKGSRSCNSTYGTTPASCNSFFYRAAIVTNFISKTKKNQNSNQQRIFRTPLMYASAWLVTFHW